MTASEPDARAPSDEADRYGLVGAPSSDELQSLSDLAASIFGAPGAAVTIFTATSEHRIAATGTEPSVCALGESLCTLVEIDDVVVVPDARRDPRLANHPTVTARPGIRFYATAPMRSPDGALVGQLCVFDHRPRRTTATQRDALGFLAARATDILELRLRSGQLSTSLEELTEARDELARSNVALSHFAAQVSHDLRNPLMAVRANAEVLAGEPVIRADPELAAAVDRIADAARGMSGMIHDVLSLAQEGGRPTVREVDLGELVDRVLLDLSPLVRQAGAHVEVEDLPVVPADPALLHSVLLNLLDNSLKFTRHGVTPQVRVHALARPGWWRICVTDNGAGVPPGHEHAVFLPFVRARPGEGVARAEGHGIGLATVHRVVTAHGGRVGLEPAPEGGTCAWFELPLDQTATDRHEAT
ncbi:GAF domain-containing sensor histidine kinase [uncultured Serinicoccus sp.]|uniref:GAF domain-containing sensor histidine kinase n=1 Tax=uncultured Serinicoccus sp. TaxID=735514 RepID=UPI0026312167|nr:GAF domain-containing sensor histidine kinase [uncultured Serinicoccus sp.]